MRYVFLLAFIVLVHSGTAQTLFDIYRLLPDDQHATTTAIKETMINNYKSGKKAFEKVWYRFDTVDEHNGYVKVSGFSMGYTWEMHRWNATNGALVAVYQQTCDPICGINQFEFFIVRDKLIEKKNIASVITGYKTLSGDFSRSKELDAAFEKNEIIATLLFELPKHGSDIVAKFGNEDSNEVYAKFFKGNRMQLTWNDSSFTKGKIYWGKD